MANLLPPSGNTVVVRRLAGLDKKGNGVWHFVKEGDSRRTLCRQVIPQIYHIEIGMLRGIKEKQLCSSCWAFGSVKLLEFPAEDEGGVVYNLDKWASESEAVKRVAKSTPTPRSIE